MIKKYIIFWSFVYLVKLLLSSLKGLSTKKRLKKDGYKVSITEIERLKRDLKLWVLMYVPILNVFVVIIYIYLILLPYERYVSLGKELKVFE